MNKFHRGVEGGMCVGGSIRFNTSIPFLAALNVLMGLTHDSSFRAIDAAMRASDQITSNFPVYNLQQKTFFIIFP